MVGALADWFAGTALFRRPLGLPIPHTAIIPNRKDEIGRTLGEFVETNFLEASVVRTKLASTAIAKRAGEWLHEPAHAERVGAEGATIATAVLNALSDDDVRDLITDLARIPRERMTSCREPRWRSCRPQTRYDFAPFAA